MRLQDNPGQLSGMNVPDGIGNKAIKSQIGSDFQ
jgi:hypothetical protein